MLDISWPELESAAYSSSSLESSEKKLFKLGLFKKLKERLNPKEDNIDFIDIVTNTTEELLKDGWETLKVEHILILVESVLDYILPYIDLPGPDIIVRPIVKKAILNTTKPLAQKLLGIL
jgi:hypothetical protein